MKAKEKTKGVFLRFPISLLNKLEAKAEKESRTRQNLIIKLLNEKVN